VEAEEVEDARKTKWFLKLCGTCAYDFHRDLEHREALHQALNSVCELGFEKVNSEIRGTMLKKNITDSNLNRQIRP
jgi:hypothetical protein